MSAVRSPGQGPVRRDRGVSPLQEVPGVGPRIAEELEALGLKEVADLRGRDPARLYERTCLRQGTRVDRCVLYVYRCAVHYAETPDPDPELLKWWRWKDRSHPAEERPTS